LKSSIIDSIKSLPPLSKTILDINRIYADEESGIGDLAEAIVHDPMIVANLLKVANSPFYSVGTEIRNVHQAVGLFGMAKTRSIALANSMRKLLNVDMKSYGITSEKFAEISSLQALLMQEWYSKIDREKADKLYLAAFLQETGKILISSEIIKEDEDMRFKSEIELSNNIAETEKSYVGVTSSEVAAEVFKHWGFDDEFIEMIQFSDVPFNASEEIQEYAMALHIVKTIIPINKPFSEQSINFGINIAKKAGYDEKLLQNVIDEIVEKIEISKAD